MDKITTNTGATFLAPKGTVFYIAPGAKPIAWTANDYMQYLSTLTLDELRREVVSLRVRFYMRTLPTLAEE